MSSSSQVDERTLREIYLAAFEGAIKKSKPWTVMCSYNKINGIYAAENKKFLNGILRDEWGFDGFVMSDWGAVNNRPADLAAGMDLEMPSSSGQNDRRIVKAVKEGRLSEADLDKAVENILNIVFRRNENRNSSAAFDMEADHRLARKIEEECAILLKNNGVLPLDEKSNVAFIGYFAENPRYQGGGSSHINSFMVESALEMSKGYNVSYAKGYTTDSEAVDSRLMREAVTAAAQAGTAVIFAGLPYAFESEGYDRTHMRLPECQNQLIKAVCAVNKNVVVVLHNGSPVEMPWIDDVSAVLEMYLGGQAVGGATVNLLFGKANPSGHLAETFPLKLEDNPSYLYYTGEGDVTEYREGVFVGYRYYDKKKMPVLFPFGHGLSYTEFRYSGIKLSRQSITEDDLLTVTAEITNTGKMAGKEVVQLYVGQRTAM